MPIRAKRAVSTSRKSRRSGFDASGGLPSQALVVDLLPDGSLVPLPAVERLLSVSATTIWRWSRMGLLKPVRIAGSTRWRLGDLRAICRGTSA